jgi:hypothetical protein
VALATKHGKGRVVARPFRAGLGAKVVVPPGLDTDRLGTFTGEMPRQGTPLEMALRKARLGMAASGVRFGLASEGSFGPHPTLPFLPVAHELLLFVDDELGVQIVEQESTTETNFAHLRTATPDRLDAFLSRAGFPAHALIVRPAAPGGAGPIYKGLTTLPALREAIVRCRAASADGHALIEADMRADRNPTRMRVIGRLAVRMVRRLRCRCPACETPGWGVIAAQHGLPCRWCGAPTDLSRGVIVGCALCGERRECPRTDGLLAADPGDCARCNP